MLEFLFHYGPLRTRGAVPPKSWGNDPGDASLLERVPVLFVQKLSFLKRNAISSLQANCFICFIKSISCEKPEKFPVFQVRVRPCVIKGTPG